MANTVIINMEVDTQKLVQNFPNGGTITTHDIIVMGDGQADSYFENGYPDKLVSMASPDDIIRWRMVPKNGTALLTLTSYQGDATMLNVLTQQPAKLKGTTDWGSTIKTNAVPNTATHYTYTFKVNQILGITWTWDPSLRIRY